MIDGAHLYWTNTQSNSIARATLDGKAVNERFITGAFDPTGIAVGGDYIYWCNTGAGESIGRAKLDGTDVNQRFITGLHRVSGVAVDNHHIYWASPGDRAIGRANLNGTNVDRRFVEVTALDVGVNGRYLYWTTQPPAIKDHPTGPAPFGALVGRDTVDGDRAHLNNAFIRGAAYAYSLAFGYKHIYWTNRLVLFRSGPRSKSESTIGRANLDASQVDERFLTEAGDSALGVAVGLPIAQPSLDDIDFGHQSLHTIGPPRTLTIGNTGTGPLHISRVRVSRGDVDDFLVSHDTCLDDDLPVGATCSIHFRFAPSDSAVRSATLTVASDDPRSPLEIRLTGTGGEARVQTRRHT